MSSPYDASKKRPIRGHSHTPRIAKGAYNVGASPTGRLKYNQGPIPWQDATGAILQSLHAQAKMAEQQQEMDALKMSGMCGDCIGTKVTGGHDPKTDQRRECPLCGTLWRGLEPKNSRREAILEQRERRKGRGSHDATQ